MNEKLEIVHYGQQEEDVRERNRAICGALKTEKNGEEKIPSPKCQKTRDRRTQRYKSVREVAKTGVHIFSEQCQKDSSCDFGTLQNAKVTVQKFDADGGTSACSVTKARQVKVHLP